MQQEIWEKKQKLLHFKTIEDVPQPANVKANLRDYQKEGFKWLNFLDEFKWGGCLADDMTADLCAGEDGARVRHQAAAAPGTAGAQQAQVARPQVRLGMVALTPGLRRRSFEFASVSGLAPSAAALGSSVSVCFVSVGVSTPDICCSIFRLLWIAIAWRGGDSGGLFLHALRSFSSRW
jgi:hypothetical protein